MHCIMCKEELKDGAEYCPFCGAKQSVDPAAPTQTDPFTGQIVQPRPAKPVISSPAPQHLNTSHMASEESLIMRAGKQIWHFEEPEGRVPPGARRPLLVMDEQAVHLAHTDRRLEPNELLQRVRFILASQEVPVDVNLVRASWFSDLQEGRPRLIAYLRDHPYSDIKMIMGVDYMGKWASFQLHLGVEPEALPLPPPEPHIEAPTGPIICMAIGGSMAGLGFMMLSDRNSSSLGGLLIVAGIVLFIVGLVWNSSSKTAVEEQRRLEKQKWEEERRRREIEKAIDRLSRTFKVDDMRLFCTAMRQVFQAVVDDIVRLGGEVVRIEGGRGGFFQAEEGELPAPRRADAAGV